jgi:DNA polymerase-3 subunit beta
MSRLSFDTAAMTKALALASKASLRRSNIPILTGVKISACDGIVSLLCTDMECALSVTLAADTSEHTAGDVVLPVAAFAAALKMATGIATLTVAGERATIGGSSFPTMPAEDFPQVTQGVMRSFTMPAATLSRLLATTAPCVSTEETRYYLNGVFLANRGGALVAVATDGHRLAKITADLPEDMPERAEGWIIPRQAVKLMQAMLGNRPAGAVTVALSDFRMALTVGPVSLHTRLIDGTYPEYDRVIPRGGMNILTTNAAEFVKQAVRLTGGNKRGRVCLVLDDAGCRMTYNDGEGVHGSCAVGGVYTGAPFEIGFNAYYVASTLAHVVGDMDVAFIDSIMPALFTDVSDPAWCGVVMPVRA